MYTHTCPHMHVYCTHMYVYCLLGYINITEENNFIQHLANRYTHFDPEFEDTL